VVTAVKKVDITFQEFELVCLAKPMWWRGADDQSSGLMRKILLVRMDITRFHKLLPSAKDIISNYLVLTKSNILLFVMEAG
jgi:hypothetical protein